MQFLDKSTISGLADSISAVAAPAFFEPLLNAIDAAHLLGGIHPKTLMRKARLGEIPGYQFARGWFFRASELDSWLKTLVPSKAANVARVN